MRVRTRTGTFYDIPPAEAPKGPAEMLNYECRDSFALGFATFGAIGVSSVMTCTAPVALPVAGLVAVGFSLVGGVGMAAGQRACSLFTVKDPRNYDANHAVIRLLERYKLLVDGRLVGPVTFTELEDIYRLRASLTWMTKDDLTRLVTSLNAFFAGSQIQHYHAGDIKVAISRALPKP